MRNSFHDQKQPIIKRAFHLGMIRQHSGMSRCGLEQAIDCNMLKCYSCCAVWNLEWNFAECQPEEFVQAAFLRARTTELVAV